LYSILYIATYSDGSNGTAIDGPSNLNDAIEVVNSPSADLTPSLEPGIAERRH
jgi:hypothetical protein